MPINIPNTTATTVYQYFGCDESGRGGVYSNGYLFVANGLVDVLLFHGVQGSGQPVGPFTLATGLTPIVAGLHPANGQLKDPVAGVGIRAQNAMVSSPAQQFFGALFEPGQAALQTGSPFSGTLSSSGGITPGQNLVDTAGINAQATPISVPNSALTALTFQQNFAWNTNTAIWPARSGTGTQISVNTSGIYQVDIQLGWVNGAGGLRYAAIYKNGAFGGIEDGRPPVTTAGTGTEHACGGALNLSAGDYIELRVEQDSGGNLNVFEASIVMAYLHS